jgi:hypothetical protein
VLYIGILDNDAVADSEVVAVADDEACGEVVDDEDHDDDGFEPQQFQQ